MDPITYPCTDSNCALRLRRPTLCPLSYRGGRRNFIIKQGRPYLCFSLGSELHQFRSQLLDDLCIPILITNSIELFLLMCKFSADPIETRSGAKAPGPQRGKVCMRLREGDGPVIVSL